MSSPYSRPNKVYNDDEGGIARKKDGISTTLSDRINSLKNACLNDTLVKKHAPQYNSLTRDSDYTPDTVSNNNNKFHNVLFGKRSKAEELIHQSYESDRVAENDDDDEEEYFDENNNNNKTSNFECPPFKPPSRTPSNDSLPHSPNFDDPNIREFSYDITKNNENDNDDDDGDDYDYEEDDDHNSSTQVISINEPANILSEFQVIKTGTLATKPPENEGRFVSIDNSPTLSPKFHRSRVEVTSSMNNELIDEDDQLFKNVIRNISYSQAQQTRSRSASSSSAASSASSNNNIPSNIKPETYNNNNNNNITNTSSVSKCQAL